MNARPQVAVAAPGAPAPDIAGPIPVGGTDPDAGLRARAGWRRALHARTGAGALLAGLVRGFHPQLLLAWIIVLLLPALIAALPIATWLQLQLGHLPQAQALAEGRDAMLIAEALRMPGSEAALLGGSALFSLLLALALSPWLTGMVVAQIRTVYRLRTGGLLRAGLGEYPRMLRLLLFSSLPLGAALALGAGAVWWAASAAGPASDGSGLPYAHWAAVSLLVVLFAGAHCSVEAARAWLGADLALRSVVDAWRRGVGLLMRRPLATFTVYLGTSAVGYALALAFAWLRLQVDGSGWIEAAGGFALTQLVVASLAWGRSARLHGLADLATAAIVAREPDASREASEAGDAAVAGPRDAAAG